MLTDEINILNLEFPSDICASLNHRSLSKVSSISRVLTFHLSHY